MKRIFRIFVKISFLIFGYFYDLDSYLQYESHPKYPTSDTICVYTSDTMYDDFVLHPKMTPIRDRTVWLHVNVPGQEPNAKDLPSE